MKIEGYTVAEIAKILSLPYRTVQKRLQRSGIEPITTGTIYPFEALKTVEKMSIRGRPKKPKEDEMPATKTAYETEAREPPALYTAETAPAYGENVIDLSRFTGRREKNGVRFHGGEMVLLPYVGKAAAGVPIEVNEPTGYGVPFPKRHLKGKWQDYFTIGIYGTSMTEFGISDGDDVVIRKTSDPKPGKVMLIRHQGETTLKRLIVKETKEGEKYFLRWEDGSGREDPIEEDDDWEIQGEYHMSLLDFNERHGR